MPDQAEQSSRSRPTPFNPEGVLMLGTALLADIISMLCLALNFFFGLGEVIAVGPNVFFTVVLGGWMYARGGGITTGQKMKNFFKRRAPLMIARDTPLVGSFMLFAWTINVIMFLRQP